MKLLEFLHKVDESVLLEAAKDRYMQMFQNIPQEVYAASRIDDSKIGDIIDNTMRAMQRSDRVTWALRLTRYHILQLAKDNAMKIVQANQAAQPQLETASKVVDYTEKEQRRMSVKSNLPPNELEVGGNTVATGTFLTKMEHFLSLPIRGIKDYQFAWQTPADVIRDLRQMELEWQSTRASELSHTEDYNKNEIKKIISFKDGSAWFDLQRSSCEIEGDAMGHCGNTADTLDEHTVLSYRTPVEGEKNRWKPHMTFILNKEDGTLGEMKGRANEKPVEKYYPYIIELLKQPYIKGFGPGGYQPENNFSMNDLPEEEREMLEEINPGLMTIDRKYKKFGMTGELAKQIENKIKSYSGETTEYHSNTQEFTVEDFKDLKQATEYVGGNTAQWAAKVLEGDEFVEWYGEDVSDDTISDLFSALPNRILRKISDYVERKYGGEHDEDDYDYENPTDITNILRDEGDDIYDLAARSAARGYEYGTEKEMVDDFDKWLKDVSGNDDWSARIVNNWDGKPIDLRIPEDEAAAIASDDEILQSIGEDGWNGILEYKDFDEPYNGWYGYDEEGAKEAFVEEFDDNMVKVDDDEKEEVEA